MGKQLFVRATFNDEKKMISYLKSIADIKLIGHFVESEQDLFRDDLEIGFSDYAGMYYIWNMKFAWDFEIKKTNDGGYYVSDSEAPVIQYSRRDGNSGGDGRIYWSKYFAAPNGLMYDVEAFDLWYETVAKWIRKNSAGKLGQGRPTYYLPEAWEELQKLK